MGVTENLKRGVTELVLLGLLTQQDMYGYEMAQALRDRSSGKFVLLETSMYPTLYRLQDHHYISSYEELVGSGGNAPITILSPPERLLSKKFWQNT